MRNTLAAVVCVLLAVGLFGCGGGGGGGGGGDVVTVPADPTGLTTLVLSSSQIDLTWTDNSSNEESFKIERGTDGTTFAEIASVAAGIVTYSDTGLTDTTAYYYRVRAYNSAGYSGYTAVASGITSPGKSAFSGVVYEQTSDNGIVPAGGADVIVEVFSAKPSKSGGPGSGILGPPLSTTTAKAGSNGRYSISSVDVPRGSTVRVSISGSEMPQSQETFTAAGADEKSSAIGKKRGRTKHVIKASSASSVNTYSDTTLPSCDVLVPAGAVAGDVADVVLTPFHRAEVLPVRLPDNYAMIAAGDFHSASSVTFASGKEADVYVILPSGIRAEDLSTADIRLMELINGVWVIATGKGKAHTTGLRVGYVGPHDSETPAKLGGVRPWCWVVAQSTTAQITGTVKNAGGAAIAGAFVFGGGSKTHTASDGSYTLKNVAAVKANMLVSITVTADGYDSASQFAGVSPGQTTSGINFTLQTSSQTAELTGKVTSAATSAAIAGATVTLRTDAGLRSMKYNDSNTLTNLTDDTFYVTPPAGVSISTYQWKLSTPAAQTFASSQATGSSVVINQLATEAAAAGYTLGIGAYKVELEMTLAGGKKVTLSGGFLYSNVGLQVYISDVKLPLTFDDRLKLTGVTDGNGNYTITNIPPGEAFYAQATVSGYTDSAAMMLAAFTAGEKRTQDFSMTVVSNDTTAPSVPSGLTASAIGSSQINVTWTASTDSVGVSGYTVYRNGTIIATTGGLSFNDTGLSAGTQYAYTVAAYDAAGNASAQSSAVNATTMSVDTAAPSAPANLVAGPTSPTQIGLSWLLSSDNVGVSGYYVYRGGTLIGTATTTSYYDTGLTASTTYSYEVAAYDASGNVSSKSSAVGATTPAAPDTQAPSIPAGLAATVVSSGQIDLAWSASTDNVAVAGYKIYRNSVNVASVAGISYSDSGLTASTAYAYTVSAYDAAGNASAQSGSVSATTSAAAGVGPVAWWKFDESSGTIAGDSSGNGNNGTVYGATWSGSALSFDGVDDVVVVPHATSINLGAEGQGYTVQGWFKTSSQSLGQGIVGKRGLRNTPSPYPYGTIDTYPFNVHIHSSTGYILRGEHASQSSAEVNTYSPASVADGRWHHFADVRDPATQTFKLYVDGVLVDTKTDTLGSLLTDSGTLVIGHRKQGADQIQSPFNGSIKDIKIHNYARSATEIQTDYAGSISFFEDDFAGGFDSTRWTWNTNSPNSSYVNDTVNGILEIHSGTLAGAGGNIHGVAKKTLASADNWTLEIRSKTTPQTGRGWSIGFTGWPTNDGGIAFGEDSSGNLSFGNGANGSSASTPIPTFDVTAWHVYTIVATGSQVDFFVDGSLVASHTTNIPVGKELHVVCDRGTQGTANTLYVDYVKWSQNTSSSLALLLDKFTDGNYTANPLWTVQSGGGWGATNYFLRGDGQDLESDGRYRGQIGVQLSAPANAGSAEYKGTLLSSGNPEAGKSIQFYLENNAGKTIALTINKYGGGFGPPYVNKNAIGIWKSSGEWYPIIQTTFAPNLDQAYTVKMTWDAAGTWRLYVDGVLIGTASDTYLGGASLTNAAINHQGSVTIDDILVTRQ